MTNADPARARQVQRTRPPLVGHGKRFPAAAPDQSAAPRLDRRPRAAAAASACSTSAAAAASSPIRWRAAAPTCSASTSPTKPLKVAQLHAIEAATPRIEYREVAVEALAAEMPAQLRRRHLHGDARARPRSRRRSSPPAGASSSPAAGCSSRRSTATPRRSLFAIVGAEHVLQLLPKGTHEYAKFIAPERARRAGAATPASSRWRRAAWNTTRSRGAIGCRRDTSVNYLVACRKPA